MRRYHIIVLGLVVIFAAAHVAMYRAVRRNSLAVFGRDQQRAVQAAAQSLQANLESLGRQMRTLADQVAGRDPTDNEAIPFHAYRGVIGAAALDVVRLRPDGTVLQSLQNRYVVGDDPGWRRAFPDTESWAHGTARLTGLVPVGGNAHADRMGVLLVTPVRAPRDHRIQQFLVFVLAIQRLVDRHILPLALGDNGRGWIVDAGGLVLWHPELNVGAPIASAFSHEPNATWQRIRKTISHKSGSASMLLNVGGTPSVLSCGSVEIEDQRWTVCIQTPQSDVVAAVAMFPRWLAASLIGILAAGGAVIFYWGTAQQRTRQAEEARAILERTLEHQKILALGQLAAGVAHEVGNPLASISALCQLLLRKHPDAEVAEPLSTIIDHVDRIATTVHRVLDFAKPAPMVWEPLQINAVVHDVMAVLRYDPRMKDVHVEIELAEPSPATLAMTPAVIQVLTNVVINALDAISGREGRLTITTAEHDGSVWISVTDNGDGMSPDDVKRAFEPFFTTKPAGQGTGLGLAVSRSTVEQHGGTITLTSHPGAGTTVRIGLPCRDTIPAS